MNRAAVRYDRSGDQHYDVTSAFIKSIRGSDVDAAVHYLARMIEAGEDPRFIARRLMIHASEDVGMADPDGAADSGRGRPGGAAGRPAGGADRVGAGHHSPGHRTEVQRCDHRDRRGDGRRPGGQGRLGAAAAAGRPLPGRGEARQRPDAMSTRMTGRDAVVAQQYPPDELVGRDYYRPTGYGPSEHWRRVPKLRRTIRGETGRARENP